MLSCERREATLQHIISLGAGVQSSTMALMAAAGEITPMPSSAIFADTQAEPRAVYEWLDWLEKQLPFPVHRVTAGNLAIDSTRIRTSRSGKKYQWPSPPAFTKAPGGGTSGMLMRQCTADYKLAPIFRKMRQLLPGRGSQITQWIGISSDELQRARPARPAQSRWLTNRWPLVELHMTRLHCIEWMRAHGYPTPPRSACIFCPYHSNAEWRRLKNEAQDEFRLAVEYEAKLQQVYREVEGFRGTVWLHRDLVPLDTVDLTADDRQSEMFDEHGFAVECEGMCGV